MTASSAHANVDVGTSPNNGFVRRVSRRYFVVLAAIIALVLADQAVIQPLLVRLNDFAPAINIAGRQRMLSQKIAKAALALQAAPDEAARAARSAELRQAVADWSSAHVALRKGDERRGIARLSSPEIQEQWNNIEPHFVAMQSAAARLGSAEALLPDHTASIVAAIVAHEATFLRLMDRQVFLFEAQAGTELQRLRWCAAAIAALIVALVCALGWFVVRPATRAIRAQVHDLETQVASRTRNLSETLTALRSAVAEREAIEERNRDLAMQLAHANRVDSVGHLAAGLAHELNQPFAAIVNYTEACGLALERSLDEPTGRQLRDYVERVRQASLRAGGIVRQIRDFVRPGATSTLPVDLMALVREVLELCRAEIRRAESSVSIELPSVHEIVVEVSPIQIQQVLVNLIQNALQASAGTAADSRRIALRVRLMSDTVQVDVIDSGPGLGGIDPETLFVPFHTTKADGLGIGLSICRSIIERHHGTIWAQSLSPNGAQFSFALPLMKTHVVEVDRQSDRICR